MTEEARRTPLYNEHVGAGARMVDFAGWSLPVQYQSILAEHQAVRGAAGLFDASHMGEIEITGPRAQELCATLFTNDARVLAVGKAQYSMIPNETGGIVDDIIVYRLGDERFFVCVNASNAARDLAWIRARASGGVTIEDLGEQTALIAIQGPRAATILDSLSPGVTALARFACEEREVGPLAAMVARTGYTGEDGFELFCAADDATTMWRLLLAAAPQVGETLACCGLGARDTLRVEAALPLYGHELGGDISPYEVRTGWAVKTNRPQMVGYDALRRSSGAGSARRLIGLLVDGGIAREGATVYEPGSEAVAGVVTSGTHSPTLGRAVAMALVGRQVAERAGPAAALEVEIRGKRRAAVVTSLPFYVKRPGSREPASGETGSSK